MYGKKKKWDPIDQEEKGKENVSEGRRKKRGRLTMKRERKNEERRKERRGRERRGSRYGTSKEGETGRVGMKVESSFLLLDWSFLLSFLGAEGREQVEGREKSIKKGAKYQGMKGEQRRRECVCMDRKE